MVKPEWGTKRACQKCKAHFYDLKSDPIVCPKCQTEFQPEILKKRRRGRLAAEEDTAKANVTKGEFIEEDLALAESPEDLDDLGFEQESDLLEDAADLVEEDDMGDVIERPSDSDME